MVKTIERVLEGETLRKVLNRENIFLLVDGEAEEFFFKKTVGAYVSYNFMQGLVLNWKTKQGAIR